MSDASQIVRKSDGVLTIVDQSRQPFPDPCGDCGREHLNGEHMRLAVPEVEPGVVRLAWEGCVDCWVRRTDPVRA